MKRPRTFTRLMPLLLGITGAATLASGEVVIHYGSAGTASMCEFSSARVDMVLPFDEQTGDPHGDSVFRVFGSVGGGSCRVAVIDGNYSVPNVPRGLISTNLNGSRMFYHGTVFGPDSDWSLSGGSGRAIGFNSNMFPEWYPFLEGRLGYVGVSFEIEERSHYGWIKLRRSGSGSASIVAWAYETEPDTPIVVDECGCNSYANFECDGELNFFDIASYLDAFLSSDESADVAEPFNEINIVDLSFFITEYVEGSCE